MISWDLFYTFLKDVKHRKINWEEKRQRHNYNVEKSRFNSFYVYFDGKPFNKYTCNSFLSTYENKSNSTKNNYLKILKNVCAYLRYYDLETPDVLQPIESIQYWEKKNLKTIEILYPQEIKKLAELRLPYGKMKIQTNRRWRAIIYTLGLGFRINELIHIRWEDYRGDHVIIWEGKTNESERKVYISSRLQRILERLQRYEHGYMFGSHLGKLDRNHTSKELKRRAEIVGIEKRIHTHIFRHSFAWAALNLYKMPLQDVMAHLGHKDPRVTLQYAHIGIEQTKQVVEAHELYGSKKQSNTKELLHYKIDHTFDQKKLESIYQLL